MPPPPPPAGSGPGAGPATAPRRFVLGDPGLPGAFARPAVTVGVFDGVHLGHQALLAHLVAWATEANVDPVVVTFDVHPRTVLRGEGPALITTLEHRLGLLGRCGVRGVVVLPFDRAMASWTAEEFAQRVFVDALGASRVLVGKNHRFGKDRGGDFALLSELGRRHGFEAREVELEVMDDVISSTAIRERIAAGDLTGASELLGRPVSVLGRVVEGDRRGRQLGFPTANLDLRGSARPPRGVYAARARVTGDPLALGVPQVPAVVNVGRRPTFKPEGELDLVEVHLLEPPAEELYGRWLEVSFVARLRDERRFAGPAELVAQINKDIADARRLLATP